MNNLEHTLVRAVPFTIFLLASGCGGESSTPSERAPSPDVTPAPSAPVVNNPEPVANEPEEAQPARIDYTVLSVDPEIYSVSELVEPTDWITTDYLDNVCGGTKQVRRVTFAKNHTDGEVIINHGNPFPGQIVSAKKLIDGTFDSFRPARKPYRVFIGDLQGLGQNRAVVEDASWSSTDMVLNDLLYANETNQTPVLPLAASIKYSSTETTTKSAMELNLGASFDGFSFKAGSTDSKENTSHKVSILVTQRMFTYNFEPLTDDLNDFLDGVPVEELRQGLDEGDQLAVITQVVYGRLIAISVETSSRVESNGSNVGASFKKYLEGASMTDQEQRIVNNSDITITVYGGGSAEFIDPASISAGNLYTLVKDFELGEDWSPRRDPGMPIGYVASFLQPRYPTMLHGKTTEYIETIFDPDGGDNLWNLQEVGADTHDHHVEVGLDGAPFFSGGDWGAVSKVGEVDGILRHNILEDHALKFGSHVYADSLTNVTLKGSRKVIPRVFVNGTKHTPTIQADGSFYFNFQLQPGWNEVQITDGSQTHHHVLEMEGMSGLSLVMDSNRCE